MAKLSTSDRDKLPASKFAEPDKRAYPIEDAAHAKNAKARASQAVKAGRMSKAEEGKIDGKADAVIRRAEAGYLAGASHRSPAAVLQGCRPRRSLFGAFRRGPARARRA